MDVSRIGLEYVYHQTPRMLKQGLIFIIAKQTKYIEHQAVMLKEFASPYVAEGYQIQDVTNRPIRSATIDEIYIYIEISSIGDVYTRYPETLVSGLTKIGGLIALIKVLAYMRFIHKLQFESQLANQTAPIYHVQQTTTGTEEDNES